MTYKASLSELTISVEGKDAARLQRILSRKPVFRGREDKTLPKAGVYKIIMIAVACAMILFALLVNWLGFL